MPADYETPASLGRPKYPINGSGLVIYRGSKAYALLTEVSVHNELLEHSDVRLLNQDEVRQFENHLPFPVTDFQSANGTRELRLGDLLHLLTKRAGISECGACRQRRRILNRVVIWGWWKQSEA